MQVAMVDREWHTLVEPPLNGVDNLPLPGPQASGSGSTLSLSLGCATWALPFR